MPNSPMHLPMEGFAFPLEVLRTGRKKSISIHLDEGLVKVRVPKSLSAKSVRDLIAKHSAWIQKKLQEQQSISSYVPKDCVSGAKFPYLGRFYRLYVKEAATASVKLKNGCLELCHTGAESPRSLLEAWYRARAELRLIERTQHLAKRVGVSPKSVSIKNYKARWGSCSIDGAISYNWRIILAPTHIADYVVVHELCHCLEHNHSAQFWQHVEKYVPRWRECRSWLKYNPIVF